MRTLIATVGLPRSGKTTWALNYSKQKGVPIVSPDAVRLAVHGQRFAAAAERYVWATVHGMIGALFLAGHTEVILDATNTTRKRRDDLKSADWKTVFYHIDTPADVCRSRAADDAEILPVIDRMASQFEPLADDEPQIDPLGATGKFPEGSCGPDDEGELRLAVGADEAAGLVRIQFGKPIAWLGLPSTQAKAFANAITRKAEQVGI